MPVINTCDPMCIFTRIKDAHPLTFSMNPGPERRHIRKLIEEHGGLLQDPKVADQTGGHRIALIEPNSVTADCRCDLFSTTYIEDCVSECRLLPTLKMYRVGPSIYVDENYDPFDVLTERLKFSDLTKKIPEGEICSDFEDSDEIEAINVASTKLLGGRLAYSYKEQISIVNWIIEHGTYSKLGGNEIWKLMQSSLNGRRTWQSMKEHFKKQIIPKLHSMTDFPQKDRDRILAGWDGAYVDSTPQNTPPRGCLPLQTEMKNSSVVDHDISTHQLSHNETTVAPNNLGLLTPPMANLELNRSTLCHNESLLDPDQDDDILALNTSGMVTPPRPLNKVVLAATSSSVLSPKSSMIMSSGSSTTSVLRNFRFVRKKRKLWSRTEDNLSLLDTTRAKRPERIGVIRESSPIISSDSQETGVSPNIITSPLSIPFSDANKSRADRTQILSQSHLPVIEPTNTINLTLADILNESSSDVSGPCVKSKQNSIFLRSMNKKLIEIQLPSDLSADTDVDVVQVVSNKTVSSIHRETKMDKAAFSSSSSEVGSKSRSLYTEAEDKALVKYIKRHKLFSRVGGNTIWRKMEKKQVCPGRSWQSLRHRFLHSISNRLDLPRNKTSFRHRQIYRPYSSTEDDAIVDFIVYTGRYSDLCGRSFWELMVTRNVVADRTWQSLKERFLKNILPRIHTFKQLSSNHLSMFQKFSSNRTKTK